MNKSLAKNHSHSMSWWIASGAAIALALVAIKNFPAIRRYLKMEMM